MTSRGSASVGTAVTGASPPAMRIDKFLWFVRLSRSRSAAQALAERAVIRLNGRRIDRAHAAVRPGDLITLPHGASVIVIRVIALPNRRGPAPEAEASYERLILSEPDRSAGLA